MEEIKRIFTNRRLWLFMIIIILMNAFLFCKEQKSNDYRLDLSLGTVHVSLEDYLGNDFGTSSLDAKACLDTYDKWLAWYQEKPSGKAARSLSEEEKRLLEIPELTKSRQQDLVAIRTLMTQLEYRKYFEAYLQKIKDNKTNSLSFSIFSKEDSFTQRNIIKTASQFEILDSTEISIDKNGALEAFFTCKFTDYLLLLFLLLIVLSFLDERRIGLWGIIHSSPEGRIRLGIIRAGILLGTSIIATLILYGCNLGLAASIYGGFGTLGRAVQSSPLFMKLPVRITFGDFIIQYTCIRIGTVFFLALFCWLLLSAASNVKYALIFFSLAAGTEFLLYTFLPVQSSFNVFKYFNLFTYVNLSALYTSYLNINLFGYPFGIREISLAGMLPMLVLLFAGILTVCTHKKPAARKSRIDTIITAIQSRTDRINSRLHLFGFEVYKSLFIQKGILILVFLVWSVSGSTFLHPVNNNTLQEAAAKQYTKILEGRLDAELDSRIAAEQEKLDIEITEYNDAKTRYQSGVLEYAQFHVYETAYEAALIKQEALDLVKTRTAELKKLEKNIGQPLWLLNESPYESLWGENGESSRQGMAMTAIFSLALLLSGCFTYEKQSGMKKLLFSTMHGRSPLLFRKILLAAALSMTVWGITYGWEARIFFTTYTLSSLSAPVQSLALFTDFPLSVSIRTFFILLYVLRFLMLLICSLLILLLSATAGKIESSALICTSILLPSLLGEMIGILPFRILSLSRAVSMVELIHQNLFIPICFLMLCMATVCILVIIQIFCSNKTRLKFLNN